MGVKGGFHGIALCFFVMALVMATAVSAFAGESKGDFDSVTVIPMHNGYCALSFSVPGTTKEVFVTGIREDKAEDIYNKLISGWKDGEEFEITDESIIDAEKTMDSDDGKLCFAASGCNMLIYSGWAGQIDPTLGLVTEDDLFEEIIPEFNNTPDNIYFTGIDTYGFLEWFFSGTLSSESGAETKYKRSLRNFPGNGGYLTDYDISSLGERGEFVSGSYPQKLKRILSALKEGMAVEVGNKGHAVTCFGMVTDTVLPDTDEAHYQAFIVADSDNDKYVTGTDRRTLPNRLTAVPIANRKLFNDDLREYALLRPYDGQAGIESNPDASRNRRQDPDLRIQGLNVAAEQGPALLPGSVISEGGGCFLNIGIQAYDDVGFDGKVTIHVTVYRDGSEIAEREMPAVISLEKYDAESFSMDFSSEKFPAGDYRAEALITAAPPVVEAFLCNNKAELSFKVIGKGEMVPPSPTVDLEIENIITDHTANAYMVYNEEDLDFLRKNDMASVAIANYDEGEEPVYRAAVSSFGDYGLPRYVRVEKEKEFTRVCVTVQSGGRVYYLYSPVYRVPFAQLSVTLDADTTEEFSPVPYMSTHFNGEEKISFTLRNESVAYDEAFDGEYFLTADRFTGKPLSDYVSFTIEPGEVITGVVITGWKTSLTNSVSLYLAWRQEGEDYIYTNSIPIGRLEVLPAGYSTVSFEPGDGTGGMEDVRVDVGKQIRLPDCRFTAPSGKVFYTWKETKSSKHADPGEEIPIESNRVFKAIYRDALLKGHSVDFDEEAVRVHFFLDLADEAVSDGVSINLRWADKEESVSVSNDNYDSERGAYRVTCPLDWENKNETITAEVYRNGQMIAVRTYSIAKYYDDLTSNYSEYELNEYDGDSLYTVLISYTSLLDGSGFDDTSGAESYAFFPSCYDSEDLGAMDIPYSGESQEDFEGAIVSEGYTGTYDANAHGITVTVPEGAEVRYGTEEGFYDLVDNPTYVNAGIYRTYYEASKAGLSPVVGSETVEILKADVEVTAPLANSLLYDGSAQKLVTAGAAEAGGMLYALGEDAENVPKEDSFSGSIPTGISAGTYYVWYKAAGDENHNEGKPEVVPVVIGRKDLSGAIVKLSADELPYTGKEQIVTIVSAILDGMILPQDAYKLTGDIFGTEPGTYTVTLEGVGNYKGEVSASWTIKAAPTGLPIATETPIPTTVPVDTVTPTPIPTTVPIDTVTPTITPALTLTPTATSAVIVLTPRPAKNPVATATPASTASPSKTVSPSPKASDASGSGSGGGSSSSGKNGSGSSVSTGDETHADIWIILMALAMASIAMASGRKKPS
ncbi:MAG: hypothetical protein Q4A32_01460 [Lachnospiraceae bacterium]|nr:hypothetical protein [Lachnospiraceae bacterium]